MADILRGYFLLHPVVCTVAGDLARLDKITARVTATFGTETIIFKPNRLGWANCSITRQRFGHTPHSVADWRSCDWLLGLHHATVSLNPLPRPLLQCWMFQGQTQREGHTHCCEPMARPGPSAWHTCRFDTLSVWIRSNSNVSIQCAFVSTLRAPPSRWQMYRVGANAFSSSCLDDKWHNE